MGKQITANTLVDKHLTRKDRVLLINPPVWETRYSWLRWNQPLDLLKLATFLRIRVGCSVELLDCMKPGKDGDVPEAWLPRDRRYRSVEGIRYPMRQFGRPHSVFKEWLDEKNKEGVRKEPTQVWITSLCSYWFESVAEMCRAVRQSLKNVLIVLVGQYPRLMADHAREACAADYLVTKSIAVQDQPSALELYGEEPPPFVAVELNPQLAVEEIRNAVNKGIYKVTFFTEDLCQDDGTPLAEIVSATKGLNKNLRFHAICGLSPQKVTPSVARVLADEQFAEIHFEEAGSDGGLDVEAYKRCCRYLGEAGLQPSDDCLSGFVWIGRPREELESIILRSFQVVDILGNLILKPFSPTPGSTEHVENAPYLDQIPPQLWSPHFFPFSKLNRISHEEYHDLYRMAAFLTEKVRSKSFDFLKGTLGSRMLRESLANEVWKIEPSPLRIID